MSFEKISSEIIHENPWWKYRHDTYKLPNGTVGDYYYGEKYGAVLVVPITREGKLVLVRQYRYLHDKYAVEFPLGGVEATENINQAAHRELSEETGMDCNKLTHIGTFEPSKGLFKDQFHIFLAEDLVGIEKVNADPTEEIEVMERRPDEFEDMIRRGEIWDGQTLAAWALVRHHLLS